MGILYFLWGFGLILVTLGVAQLYGCLRFFRRSVKTVGRLTGWETASPWTVGGPSSSGDRNSYRPVVKFQAADGSEYQAKTLVWTQAYRKPKVRMGSQYPVRYDPNSPTDARIATVTDMWLFPFVFTIVGSFLLFLALHN